MNDIKRKKKLNFRQRWVWRINLMNDTNPKMK